MRVLLIAKDLYREIGGGQTVYTRLIGSAPEIDFFYFREHEAADASRPRNATAIPLGARFTLRVLSAPPFPAFRRYQLQEADCFARSVAGQHFDIVDIPDFHSCGSLLRDAFARHGVSVDRIVLAMHGNISVSLEMGWGSAGDNVLEQRMLERDQFESADGVYAISPRYMREWQARVDRQIHYIDPICFVDVPDRVPDPKAADDTKPNLYCIGRTERRKGNDLFVELVRWLNPDAYGKAAHIGDEVMAPWGVGTRHILWDIAKKRGLEIDNHPSLSRAELSRVFRDRSIVVLPVRYDTLNLIALEALFEGCPVAISSEAGVCDYLDESFPGLPYVKIDINNFYAAAGQLNDLLSHYDEYCARLHAFLAKTIPHLHKTPDIGSIYSRILSAPSSATSAPREVISYYEPGLTLHARAWRQLTRLVPIDTYRSATQLITEGKARLVRKVEESEIFGDARYLATVLDARHVPSRLKHIAEHSEYNTMRLREKLDEIYAASSNPLFRCNFWLDIARIERVLGNEMMAVTYELRALRLVGRDAFGILPRVVRTLSALGLPLEAEVATAMYSDATLAPARVHEFLRGQYERNLPSSALPFIHVDDRRSGTPRVAIIVSLYKAAPKLRLFLTMLLRQTLVKRGSVEIILVDSGSPDHERDVIQQFWGTTGMNAVYARSVQRETIQSAWNRGIQLARAPYLVFLGVDETLYPDALEILAAELDKDASIDWVMANSLVTAVDQHGVFKNDVMPYDRTGGTKDHTYLETCYLSWVGGMYRKSIHERFGYYDPTFSAAGDTEFKNRVLPYISAKFVPKTLGLFLNYPDERTTASPRAEIEDLRAWYAHRTPGGVDYAFRNRSKEDVQQLLYSALGYRKSYCSHLSSDIEYATYLAQFLSSRDRSVPPIHADLQSFLNQIRILEFSNTPPTMLSSMNTLLSAWRVARDIQNRNSPTLRASSTPVFKILNDNRYEQHSWLWRS